MKVSPGHQSKGRSGKGILGPWKLSWPFPTRMLFCWGQRLFGLEIKVDFFKVVPRYCNRCFSCALLYLCGESSIISILQNKPRLREINASPLRSHSSGRWQSRDSGFDSKLVCFKYLTSVTRAKPSSFVFRIGPQIVPRCPVSIWSRQYPCLPGDWASLLLLLLAVAREIFLVSTVSRVLQRLPIPKPQAIHPHPIHTLPPTSPSLPTDLTSGAFAGWTHSFAFPCALLSLKAFPCCSQPGMLFPRYLQVSLTWTFAQTPPFFF